MCVYARACMCVRVCVWGKILANDIRFAKFAKFSPAKILCYTICVEWINESVVSEAKHPKQKKQVRASGEQRLVKQVCKSEWR